MSRPYRLLMIRHGQSESNIVQSAQKANNQFEHEELINSRVDWKQRLSNKGRSQAEVARASLSQIYPNGLNYFNSFYVSPFIRARETASILSMHNLGIRWNIEDRLSERIWGIYGTVSRQEQRSHFPLTSRPGIFAMMAARVCLMFIIDLKILKVNCGVKTPIKMC